MIDGYLLSNDIKTTAAKWSKRRLNNHAEHAAVIASIEHIFGQLTAHTVSGLRQSSHTTIMHFAQTVSPPVCRSTLDHLGVNLGAERARACYKT